VIAVGRSVTVDHAQRRLRSPSSNAISSPSKWVTTLTHRCGRTMGEDDPSAAEKTDASNHRKLYSYTVFCAAAMGEQNQHEQKGRVICCEYGSTPDGLASVGSNETRQLRSCGALPPGATWSRTRWWRRSQSTTPLPKPSAQVRWARGQTRWLYGWHRGRQRGQYSSARGLLDAQTGFAVAQQTAFSTPSRTPFQAAGGKRSTEMADALREHVAKALDALNL
jgi:hypothetical protein